MISRRNYICNEKKHFRSRPRVGQNTYCPLQLKNWGWDMSPVLTMTDARGTKQLM